VWAPGDGLIWLDWQPVANAPALGDVARVFKSITALRYVDGVRHHRWPPFTGRL